MSSGLQKWGGEVKVSKCQSVKMKKGGVVMLLREQGKYIIYI